MIVWDLESSCERASSLLTSKEFSDLRLVTWDSRVCMRDRSMVSSEARAAFSLDRALQSLDRVIFVLVKFDASSLDFLSLCVISLSSTITG